QFDTPPTSPLIGMLLAFSFRLPRPPCSTLFPYTTLFRSEAQFPEVLHDVVGMYEVHIFKVGEYRPLHKGRGGLVVTDMQIDGPRSEEHTSELRSRFDLVCRLLLEKKNIHTEEQYCAVLLM